MTDDGNLVESSCRCNGACGCSGPLDNADEPVEVSLRHDPGSSPDPNRRESNEPPDSSSDDWHFSNGLGYPERAVSLPWWEPQFDHSLEKDIRFKFGPTETASENSASKGSQANAKTKKAIKLVIGSWQPHATEIPVGCDNARDLCMERMSGSLSYLATIKFDTSPRSPKELTCASNLWVKSDIVVLAECYDHNNALVAVYYNVNPTEYWRVGSDGVTKAWDCHNFSTLYSPYMRCRLVTKVTMDLDLVTFPFDLFFGGNAVEAPGGSMTIDGVKVKDPEKPTWTSHGQPLPVPMTADMMPFPVGDLARKTRYEYEMEERHCHHGFITFPFDPPPPDAPDTGGGIPTPRDTGGTGTPTQPTSEPLPSGPPKPPDRAPEGPSGTGPSTTPSIQPSQVASKASKRQSHE